MISFALCFMHMLHKHTAGSGLFLIKNLKKCKGLKSEGEKLM